MILKISPLDVVDLLDYPKHGFPDLGERRNGVGLGRCIRPHSCPTHAIPSMSNASCGIRDRSFEIAVYRVQIHTITRNLKWVLAVVKLNTKFGSQCLSSSFADLVSEYEVDHPVLISAVSFLNHVGAS